MPNGTDIALRLMIVDDSVEDAEAIVSTLRNAGIAVRPLRPASLRLHLPSRSTSYSWSTMFPWTFRSSPWSSSTW